MPHDQATGGAGVKRRIQEKKRVRRMCFPLPFSFFVVELLCMIMRSATRIK